MDEDSFGISDENSVTADPYDANYACAVWDRLDFSAGGGPALISRTTDAGQTDM